MPTEPADTTSESRELTDAELEAVTAGKDSLGTPMSGRKPMWDRDRH
jgi:hypothetical protein